VIEQKTQANTFILAVGFSTGQNPCQQEFGVFIEEILILNIEMVAVPLPERRDDRQTHITRDEIRGPG
jgi:hypothetical protein